MIQNMFKTVLALLAATLLVTTGAQAAVATLTGSLSAGSPTFNRTTDRAGFPDSANNAVPYAVFEIRTGATAGTLTATVDGTGTVFDSFLALYSAPFNAGSPGTSLITADDDSGTYPHAQLTASSLSGNTTYWLVVASYSGTTGQVYPRDGAFTMTLNIDGSFATYPITTTAVPSAGGSVSCTPNPVTHGANSTCTASANAGYTFSAFSGNCTGATCVLSNVTSAQSVTATFTPTSYAITASATPLAGGSVTCTPNPVPHGGNSTCTASANAGYTFSAFSGNCAGATCVLSNVTSARTVIASFAVNSPICTLTASPARIPSGRTSTLTASCNPAATSFTWTGGTCAGTTASTCTVTPAVTTTYGVTGTNGSGSNSATATVTIGPVDLTPIFMLLLD